MDINKIELAPIKLHNDYAKKWNAHSTDFCHLLKNGNKVSDVLYRVGGFGVKLNEPYFVLLKYVEAYYEDTITEVKERKPHLESQACIIDNNGIEKVNFDHMSYPYLQGGLIDALNGKYYNIETGYLYCDTSSSMRTDTYIFLDNRYDDDKTKSGVMQVNKHDGSYKLIN